MALFNVLMIWSARHDITSYRQGMHEIAGTVLLVLEQEYSAWQCAISPDLDDKATQMALAIQSQITRDSIEAHTFWIFERIMKDLEPLYDPTPEKEGGYPSIVLYCTNIQGGRFILLHYSVLVCTFNIPSCFVEIT